MNRLTVFYDPACGICSHFRSWLEGQALWVPVEFIGFNEPEAERRFPGLREAGADREVVVMADDGGWWQGPDAWLVCLWATRAYRPWSHELAAPRFRPWLRAVVHGISRNRLRISHVLGLRSDREIAADLAEFDCAKGTCGSAMREEKGAM